MKPLQKLILAAAVVLGVSAASAQPAPWPTKPVRIVVGYGAGGPGDIVLRALANKLSPMWGQPVVVDNKPGANEIVAAIEVARQPGDGHTLILATDAMYSLNPLLRSKPGYDAVRDFTPITRVGQSNLMLFVRPDFPARNLAEFIGYAKANPGKLNFASTGNGGITHLAVSWLSKLYGLDMVQAPYNAVPALLQDLTTSRVDFTMLAAGPLMPYANSGKLKALAVTGNSRLPIAPNVPTFAESGFGDYEAYFYLALAAPAATPPQITARIADDVVSALKTSDMLNLLQSMGIQPVGETPAQFAAFLAGDRASAAKRVEAAKIKVE